MGVTLDCEAVSSIVRAALREDAKLLQKEIARLTAKPRLRSAQTEDLERALEVRNAVRVVREYYGDGKG